MTDKGYKAIENLKLDNQICFPIYLASKEIIKTYSSYLNKIGLTYTQYLIMMVLWEHNEITYRNMQEILHLDSNTLTPVIKRLVEKDYVEKCTSSEDKRIVVIRIKKKGLDISSHAETIPESIYKLTGLTMEEGHILCNLITKATNNLLENQKI